MKRRVNRYRLIEAILYLNVAGRQRAAARAMRDGGDREAARELYGSARTFLRLARRSFETSGIVLARDGCGMGLSDAPERPS